MMAFSYNAFLTVEKVFFYFKRKGGWGGADFILIYRILAYVSKTANTDNYKPQYQRFILKLINF